MLAQVLDGIKKAITCHGVELDKALEDVYENLKVLEEGMKEIFPGGTRAVEHGNIGLLDILMVTTLGPYKVREEVIGKKILDPERNPLLFSWVTALNNLPVVKELTPPHNKLVSLLQFFSWVLFS